MLDRNAFMKDLEEAKCDPNPCVTEFFLNQTFQNLQEELKNPDLTRYGYFQGGTDTEEFEELLRRNKINLIKGDIYLVLDELEKFYAVQKPELVTPVHNVKMTFKQVSD
ncbi:MAG: hypothetical protein Q4E35_03260 [Eubacteriales bacterium]|nr:hypothetical protein [Eubacteriales bacterium]